MITLTGIGDEAGNPLTVQIAATKALGWCHLEMRNVEVLGYSSQNIHDIPEGAFDLLVRTLEETGIMVAGFGSTIGNWASAITDPMSLSMERVERAIPRMHRLGTNIIRVMSYSILKDASGLDAPDQMAEERFSRLRTLQDRFASAGLTMVHENCMNYGGMSIGHALQTIANVPGLKWVFDTGNPVFNSDRDNPGHQQDSWEFYQAVRPHIAHVHIKDGIYDHAKKDCDYSLPGEGQGQVQRILDDLVATNYNGFVSIEPHTAVVFHSTVDPAKTLDPAAKAAEQFDAYISYGQRLMKMLSQEIAA